MSEFYRPHRPAVAASRAGASNAGEAAPAMPPPVGRSLQTHGGPLAYSAQQLAEALGYANKHTVFVLARHDPDFPRPVKFTPSSEGRYLASDVQRWLESKRKGAA